MNDFGILFFSFRKYYIDVKRRENAFVLNPNSTVIDPTFVRAINKRHSHQPDRDVKNFLPNFPTKQKQIYVSLTFILII